MSDAVEPASAGAAAGSADASATSAESGIQKEEEVEREAITQRSFQGMKTWYNSPDTASLKEKHGRFPMFWQDCAKWEPYAAVQRDYFLSTEQKDSAGAVDKDAQTALS